MIKVTFKKGGEYLCPSLDHINLKKFQLEGVATLQAGKFTYDRAVHGELLYHGLKTGLEIHTSNRWRIYVIVTDRWKVFVFGDGTAVVLRDWVKGHVFYDECKPGAAARVRMLRESIPERKDDSNDNFRDAGTSNTAAS
jgi:hypothetical protein